MPADRVDITDRLVQVHQEVTDEDKLARQFTDLGPGSPGSDRAKSLGL
ncbi:hypothetical protein ACXO22_02950 [Lactobacillus delbrueckii subsp. bulgaricus]